MNPSDHDELLKYGLCELELCCWTWVLHHMFAYCLHIGCYPRNVNMSLYFACSIQHISNIL